MKDALPFISCIIICSNFSYILREFPAKLVHKIHPFEVRP